MAKLSAHGVEIGRINYLTYSKAYFPDGHILINRGFGWKLHAKVKPEVSPGEAFARMKAKNDALAQDRPAFYAYRKELHSLAGMGKAWKLHAAVEAMPEDPDGVWSHACDDYTDNVHADIGEICELCKLYLRAQDEAKQKK